MEPEPNVLRDLVDTHAHPTDYKGFPDELEYRDAAGKLSLHKVGYVHRGGDFSGLIRRICIRRVDLRYELSPG